MFLSCLKCLQSCKGTGLSVAFFILWKHTYTVCFKSRYCGPFTVPKMERNVTNLFPFLNLNLFFSPVLTSCWFVCVLFLGGRVIFIYLFLTGLNLNLKEKLIMLGLNTESFLCHDPLSFGRKNMKACWLGPGTFAVQVVSHWPLIAAHPALWREKECFLWVWEMKVQLGVLPWNVWFRKVRCSTITTSWTPVSIHSISTPTGHWLSVGQMTERINEPSLWTPLGCLFSLSRTLVLTVQKPELTS